MEACFTLVILSVGSELNFLKLFFSMISVLLLHIIYGKVMCVLSGRSLCDGLITRPEESYRL